MTAETARQAPGAGSDVASALRRSSQRPVRNQHNLDVFCKWLSRAHGFWIRNLGVHDPILDVGCGQGERIYCLRRMGFTRCVGVDIAEEQVAVARNRGLEVHCEDAISFLSRSQEKWAAIVALDFVEHLELPRVWEFVCLARSRLTDGGFLVIQTPNGQGLNAGQLIYGDVTHQTIFTPRSLDAVLHQAGFRRSEFHETGPVIIYPRDFLRAAVWQCVRLAARIILWAETGKKYPIWTDNFICLAHPG